MTTDNTYSIIPTNILESDTLSDKAKLLYALLNSRCQKWGYCNAGDKHLAKSLKTSVRTIQNRLKELLTSGLIMIRNKQSAVRKILMASSEKSTEVETDIEEVEEEEDKKISPTMQKNTDHSAKNCRQNKITNIKLNKYIPGAISIKDFHNKHRQDLIDKAKGLNYRDPAGVVDEWYIINSDNPYLDNQSVAGWHLWFDGFLERRNDLFIWTPVMPRLSQAAMC